MKIRLALVLAAVTLAAGGLLAPAASAVTATVRAEAAGYTAISATPVDIPSAGGLVTDSDGSTFTTTIPTALNALDLVTHVHGVPWDMVVSSLGAYVNAIDGQTSDPTTYANWWQFNVNGYSPSVGAGALQMNAGDSYLFFQNPDGWPVAKTAKALVANLSPGSTVAPGQSFTITVVGDDLTKVNSQTEAARFDITDAAQIETPDQFTAVDGAVVHVGSRVYTPTGNTVTVSGLTEGTYRVWAEKAMDSSLVYVRSEKTVLTVATPTEAPVVVSNVKATPSRFKRNHALKVQFTLDKAAVATVSIRSASGVLLSRTTRTYSTAGAKAITWNGRTARKLGGKLKVTILAVDGFGKKTPWSALSVPVKR